MGIKSFWGQWLGKISARNIRPPGLPSIVTSLFLDMNSIFHNATAEVFMYAKKYQFMDKAKKDKALSELRAMSEEERIKVVASKILEMIFDLVYKIKPTEYLVLAVDGVAPMAKITQQRKRRYKKAKDEMDKLNSESQLDDTEDMKAPEGVPFDSNCITPGTKFMQLLDLYIQQFINDNLKLRTNIFPPNVIYSSHLTPGEGEHKIFELIRSGHIKPSTNGANVMYGTDADLVMLTLLSKLPYLHLYREEYSVRNRRMEVNVVNIDALREYIHGELNALLEIPQYIDIDTTTRDFVIMVFFEGNDFVPHIIAFDDVGKTINKMIEIYQVMSKPLTNPSGDLNWENFSNFIQELAKREEDLLKKVAAQDFVYPFTILDKASTKKYTTIDEGTFGNDMFESKVQVTLDFPKFQGLWYENALTPYTKSGTDFMIKNDIKGVPFTQMGVIDMTYQYMLGIQWVLHYYLQGTKAVSSRYIYPHHHAPLLKELGVIMEYLWKHDKAPSVESIKFSILDPKITPIHQLIAVMPPSSWKFIPEPFRGLMLTRFADLSPTDFKVEKEGIMKGQEWTASPLLSIVDPVRISRDLEDFDIPKEYRDRLPYFVKNVRRVRVPQKPQNLQDIQKMEERRIAREAELLASKPTPLDPLAEMDKRISVIEQKRESKKFEVEDKTFRKRNVFIWKREPLM